MLNVLTSAKRKLWDWPDGLVYRMTAGVARNSRAEKYRTFLAELRPDKWTTILDVGVTGDDEHFSNYLERLYPNVEHIVALSIDNISGVRSAFPGIQCVQGDGRRLPFPDATFDIVFSNAVIEHVGSDRDQRVFVQEALRVGRAIFITTPHRHFPLDAHTMLPLLHWLPAAVRDAFYRRLGRNAWTRNNLRLLTRRDFRLLFGGTPRVEIKIQRLLGLPAQLIAIAGAPKQLPARSDDSTRCG